MPWWFTAESLGEKKNPWCQVHPQHIRPEYLKGMALSNKISPQSCYSICQDSAPWEPSCRGQCSIWTSLASEVLGLSSFFCRQLIDKRSQTNTNILRGPVQSIFHLCKPLFHCRRASWLTLKKKNLHSSNRALKLLRLSKTFVKNKNEPSHRQPAGVSKRYCDKAIICSQSVWPVHFPHFIIALFVQAGRKPVVSR